MVLSRQKSMKKREEESSQSKITDEGLVLIFSSLEQWFVNSIYSVPRKNVMPVRKPNDYSIF